jgi:lipopolysaccharide biosynthesis regulator YciM
MYYKEDLQDNARPHYNFVVNQSNGEFTETALTRLSEIHLIDKDWLTAIPFLQRLEEEADFPQNIIFAQSNLMKANYQLEHYGEAVIYAEKVLSSSSKIDNNIKSDARIIIARSAMKTGDEDKAEAAYAQVESIASGELAAEALYFSAYFKNKAGNFKSSNTVVQKLAKNYSGYKYYGAKGLVVMAKNYYALDDAYQATYILESVIQNFDEFDDVVEAAQTELDAIKTEVAKTNSSVEPNDGN